MHALTLTAYNRPQYLRQVLDALACCLGIERWELFAQVEPGHPEVRDLLGAWKACPLHAVFNPTLLGLNQNTHDVLERAYKCKAELVVHLEDDTVPSPDFLDYHLFCHTHFWTPDLFSVTGFNYTGNEVHPKAHNHVCRRPWFTCQGWSVNRDRLQEMLERWSFELPNSFAEHQNLVVRGSRRELFPWLSRLQHIGFEQGTNSGDPRWMQANTRSPYVATNRTQEVFVA